MLSLPKLAQPLLDRFSIAFTRPTFQRAMILLIGFVLSVRRATVTSALWTARSLASGHFSDYHRVFSRARWSLWPLGKALAAMILELAPADQPVICPVDDTVMQHRGKKVYGKGRHRDPCRSTRTHNVWIWGHSWVVLAINVKFPFAARAWALPVLAALYRSKEVNQQEGRRHKTPIVLARQLMATLMHWFPKRRFILLGDGHYASHELARFCWRHRRRLTLVSLLHPRAHLCQAPPKRRKGQMGRHRIRGEKLPHPQDTVARAKRYRRTVSWYGGKKRRVELVSQKAHWYKATEGLAPIRWVFVHDLEGTHEDRYFYSTDPSLSPAAIVSLFTGRWSIETSFQEAKERLALATPRNHRDRSVLRTVPCLLGCFSVICLLFHRHGLSKSPRPAAYPWYKKSEVTFSDALATVRRLLWRQTVFEELIGQEHLKKLPRKFTATLLDQLSIAA
jgi:hypothetical protein